MNYLKTLLKTPKNRELQNEEKQIIDENYSQIINLSHYEIYKILIIGIENRRLIEEHQVKICIACLKCFNIRFHLI